MVITARKYAWLRRRGYSERLKVRLAAGPGGGRSPWLGGEPEHQARPPTAPAPVIVLDEYRRQRAAAH